MPEELPNKERFAELYAELPPWDIGRPQPAIVSAADRIAGSVLDAGCGTGENSLFFAERGQEVTGIDFLEGPIDAAKRKAQDRGLTAEFRTMSALELDQLGKRFDSVIDCGLFHTFSDEERPLYVAQLAGVLEPGGRLFLLCFSDREPGDFGPRRITRDELEATFSQDRSQDWRIESLDEARFEYRPEVEEGTFTPGGAIAWFTVIRRE